jgi:RNA polymerase sigma factor (sigma-70 family)
MNELIPDDTDLIQQCIRQNRFAQRILFEKYSGKMMKVCRKYIRNREDAIEVVNNAFLKVFKKISQVTGGNLEPWIKRIVINSSIDFLRSAKAYKETIFFVNDISNYETGPELNNEESDVLLSLPSEEFFAFIHQLPPASKLIFNLFAIDQVSHKEISRKLNISEGTSKWHVSEARKKLKVMIKERLNKYNYHGS